MNYLFSLPAFIVIGFIGGFIGEKLKIPAAPLVGAMVAVICFKIFTRVDWVLPRSFTFSLQVLLGVMVGASFQPAMMQAMHKIFIPVVTSSVFLVGTGLILSLIFTKLGILDISTAYLGTSPGAMSALVVLALDNDTNPTLVTCFHFFRVVFVILTTPLIFKFLIK